MLYHSLVIHIQTYLQYDCECELLVCRELRTAWNSQLHHMGRTSSGEWRPVEKGGCLGITMYVKQAILELKYTGRKYNRPEISTRLQTIIRDLKQTGRQRDDDGYSHNDIPDFVQNK
jgi:hypothetical protein